MPKKSKLAVVSQPSAISTETAAAPAPETVAIVAAPAPAKKKTVTKAAKKVAAPAPAKKARRSKSCGAQEMGSHACNCGGPTCGANVTS